MQRVDRCRSMQKLVDGERERRGEAVLRVDAWSGQRAGHDIAHVLWIVRAKLALIIPVFGCAANLLHAYASATLLKFSDRTTVRPCRSSNIRNERIPAFLADSFSLFLSLSLCLSALCFRASAPRTGTRSWIRTGQRSYCEESQLANETFFQTVENGNRGEQLGQRAFDRNAMCKWNSSNRILYVSFHFEIRVRQQKAWSMRN